MTAKSGRSLCDADRHRRPILVGPEAEFFIFDDVRFTSEPYDTGFKLDSSELPTNTGTEYEMGNMGHRPRTKGGYFPVNPVDSCQDIRSEMLSVMQRDGRRNRKASPRSGRRPARARHPLHRLTRMADKLQIYKYVVHNVAHAYGKTATFMPKPVFGDNGTGMHCPPVDLEGRHAAVCRQSVCRSFGRMPVLHRRHHQARQDAQRLHQPEHQLLQASGARLSKRRCCWPIRRATARRRAASPIRPRPRASASRCGSPIRPPIPIWPSRHADGRPRRHPEQDPPRRSRWTRTSTTCRRKSSRTCRPCAVRCVRRSMPRCRPRLPQEGRRLLRRSDRCLSGAQVGRGDPLRAHAAPGRVRHVLQRLIEAHIIEYLVGLARPGPSGSGLFVSTAKFLRDLNWNPRKF